jgi:hypothetical protein
MASDMRSLESLSCVALFLSSTSCFTGYYFNIKVEKGISIGILCDWQTAAACDLSTERLRGTDETAPHAAVRGDANMAYRVLVALPRRSSCSSRYILRKAF